MQSPTIPESVNTVVNDFCHRHNIILSSQPNNEMLAIYWTNQAKTEIEIELNLKSHELNGSKDVLWGILFTMLERTYHHVEAAIVSYIAESTPSSEIISRTVIEGSINFLYILLDDQEGDRLAQYFAHYFRNEQLEIERWIKAAANLPEERKEINIIVANDKKKQLIKLQEVIDFSLTAINLPTTKTLSKNWPNISERFRLLGLDIDHRTIYATLSSQTHSDAEDLINYFITASTGKIEMLDALKVKHAEFSRLMLYVAIGYYINATKKYAERFNLMHSWKNIRSIDFKIHQFLEEITKDYINKQ